MGRDMNTAEYGLQKIQEIKQATNYMERSGFINGSNYVVEGEFLGKYVLILIQNEKLYLFKDYKWEAIEE